MSKQLDLYPSAYYKDIAKLTKEIKHLQEALRMLSGRVTSIEVEQAEQEGKVRTNGK